MANCERCQEPVLEIKLGSQSLKLSVEPVTGVRLDQKHPEDASFLTGRVMQTYPPHFCRDTK